MNNENYKVKKYKSELKIIYLCNVVITSITTVLFISSSFKNKLSYFIGFSTNANKFITIFWIFLLISALINITQIIYVAIGFFNPDKRTLAFIFLLLTIIFLIVLFVVVFCAVVGGMR